ncbi:MAG: biotin/lipoyl-containing protein [Lachnospiraceae bacterium]|nr:biotin/lipoyl-containing protein [Lachnospiraceae bacterium]
MGNFVGMPKLDLTMDSGIITSWKIEEGSYIRKDEPLADIETGKLAQEMLSPFEGTVLKILIDENVDADVGVPIAYIGTPGEEIPPAPKNLND